MLDRCDGFIREGQWPPEDCAAIRSLLWTMSVSMNVLLFLSCAYWEAVLSALLQGIAQEKMQAANAQPLIKVRMKWAPQVQWNAPALKGGDRRPWEPRNFSGPFEKEGPPGPPGPPGKSSISFALRSQLHPKTLPNVMRLTAEHGSPQELDRLVLQVPQEKLYGWHLVHPGLPDQDPPGPDGPRGVGHYWGRWWCCFPLRRLPALLGWEQRMAIWNTLGSPINLADGKGEGGQWEHTQDQRLESLTLSISTSITPPLTQSKSLPSSFWCWAWVAIKEAAGGGLAYSCWSQWFVHT